MGLNCGYAASKAGILKLITVVLGTGVWLYMGILYGKARYFTGETIPVTIAPIVLYLKYTEETCEDEQKLIKKEEKFTGSELKYNGKHIYHYTAPCPKYNLLYILTTFAFCCWLGSIISLIGFLLVEFNKNPLFRQIDFVGHYIAGVALIVGSIVGFVYVGMAYAKITCSSYDHEDLREVCSRTFAAHFEALSFAICSGVNLVNAILYLIAGGIIQKSK